MMEIDVKQLKELIKVMVANDLTEIDLQGQAGERVKLRRGNGQPAVQYLPPNAAQHAPAPANTASAPAVPAASVAAVAESPTKGLDTISSPMVGTFYAASTPDAKPFVGVGDRVGPDTLVCILEAMKVFNEIKAETSGIIQEVLVQNGQAVEFGQPLFLVKPL